MALTSDSWASLIAPSTGRPRATTGASSDLITAVSRLDDILGHQHPCGERVTHQVNRLIAHVGPDAIDRDDQPPIGLHLLAPLLVFCHARSLPQEPGKGIKTIKHFSTRNTLPELGESTPHSVKDLINRPCR